MLVDHTRHLLMGVLYSPAAIRAPVRDHFMHWVTAGAKVSLLRCASPALWTHGNEVP